MEKLKYLAQNFPRLNAFNINRIFQQYMDEIYSISEQINEKDCCDKSRVMINFLQELNNQRKEVIQVVYDLFYENHHYHQRKSFERYSENQPLFREYPQLIEEISLHGNFEYINLNNLKYQGLFINNNREEIFLGFQYKNHLLEIPFVDNRSVELVEFMLEHYRENLEVHVSPYHMHEKVEVSSYFQRGMIRPLNFKCIDKFILAQNFSGGEYDFSYINSKFEHNFEYLQSFSVSQTSLEGVQRLEVIIKHRGQDMSMMIEELTLNDTYQELVGRCIHLDILDAYGADLNEKLLNHLDMAINIYTGDAIVKRLGERLSNGSKTIDASYRTHLMRVEQVPFADVIPIASLFMKSRALVMDWIDDMFPDKYEFK